MNIPPRSKVEDMFPLGKEATAHFLTPEEASSSFDEAARRQVGMSGEAFIATWDTGGFGERRGPDGGDVAGTGTEFG